MIIAKNRKAFHNYHILDRYEAGIVLTGEEVKALRLNGCVLQDAFVERTGGELYVIGIHIPKPETVKNPNYKEKRTRKLLLKGQEIRKIGEEIDKSGNTCVALSVYFNDNGLAKLEIAVAKGKNQVDKREAIKKREFDIKKSRREFE